MKDASRGWNWSHKIAVGDVTSNLHAERIATKTDHDLTVPNLTNGSGTCGKTDVDP